ILFVQPALYRLTPRRPVIMKETKAPTPHKRGKLGVLLPGMGAVATTLMTGVFLSRRGLASPTGSLTQQGTMNGKKGTAPTAVREAMDLTPLSDIVFGTWDIFPDSALDVAKNAGVLETRHLDVVADELSAVLPMKGVFWPHYVKRLNGTHIKSVTSKADAVEQLRRDIQRFKQENGLERAVAVWTGSTEVHTPLCEVHQSQQAFVRGLAESDPAITPSQIYAWACILEGVAFANGS